MNGCQICGVLVLPLCAGYFNFYEWHAINCLKGLCGCDRDEGKCGYGKTIILLMMMTTMNKIN